MGVIHEVERGGIRVPEKLQAMLLVVIHEAVRGGMQSSAIQLRKGVPSGVVYG